MRAKQLEILNLKNNPRMASKVSTIIYNLAFSPKIRHINLSDLGSSNAEMAEAVMKLIKISGAIETLILRNTKVEAYLTQEFYMALGENKTLKYLNLDTSTAVTSSANIQLLGKAVAMNAYRNGALEGISIMSWFSTFLRFKNFYCAMMMSEKDHEVWYGDKKLANEMEKDQLVAKFHCNLKFMSVAGSKIGGFGHNFKKIQKMTTQEWPRLLELGTKL